MLWLLKLLIFGKVCNHDWVLIQSMEPFTNDHRYLYKCIKCGKIVNKRLKIAWYGD